MEEWKAVEGYETIYEVSNLGNVRSLDRISCDGRMFKGIILKFCNKGNGYNGLKLSKDGDVKTFLIHKLVAIAFVENPCGYEQVNHMDEIKHNNFDFNLEWCTSKYNANYGTAQERKVAKQSKEVWQYDTNNNLLKKFKSACEIQRQLGYSQQAICGCCNSKRKTHKGYIWIYAKDS